MNGLSRYHRSYWEFGQDSSPIGFVDQNLHQGKAQLLLCTEYPPIEDVKTKHQITATLVDTLLQKRLFADAGTAKDNGVDEALEAENEVTVEVAIVGRKVGFRIGRHVFGGTIGSRDTLNEKRNSYIWRAWTPGMTHMGICCSVVFFVSTIIFFIPACALYPMYQERPSLTAKVFWVYVLQIIPCLGIIYCGFVAMAKDSSSWIKPTPSRIGSWASFNFLGGIGFLLHAVLSLPGAVNIENPLCRVRLTQYGADFATFWRYCFFRFVGILQLVKFGRKHPIMS